MPANRSVRNFKKFGDVGIRGQKEKLVLPSNSFTRRSEIADHHHKTNYPFEISNGRTIDSKPNCVFGRLRLANQDLEELFPEPVQREDNESLRAGKGRITDKHVGDAKCNLVGNSKWVTLNVDGVSTQFLVDTGSQVTLVNSKVFQDALIPSGLSVKSATGHSLDIKGKLLVPILIADHFIEHEIYASDSLKYNILGIDFLQTHHCSVDLRADNLYIGDIPFALHDEESQATVSQLSSMLNHKDNTPNVNDNTLASDEGLPETIADQVASLDPCYHDRANNLLHKYAHLFNTRALGCAKKFSHRIILNDERPVKQMPRRVSWSQRQIIDREIEEMLERDVIESSCSPWATPIVLVKKKDGSTRFCVDYRALNHQTKKDAFPIPNPNDILDELAGSKHFAAIDLKSGFWQIPMESSDKEKTAFCVPNGHFQFKRMPFGLANATATFQRTMESVLAGLLGKGCNVFVDDVIVYGETVNQLLERLDNVFFRISSAGMTLNVKKCALFKTEVELLGHHISAEGVSPNASKISVVENWPEPRDRRQVRSFLGLCSYYRRFVPDFAKISTPLSNLTSAKAPWKWTEVERDAFINLKHKLLTTPILKCFESDKAILIDTDASNTAIGAVLSQVHDGVEHPVAYFSRCLSGPERNYCVTRRELLAIIEALRHWRHYVMGTRILVRSDHASLTWIRNFKSPEGQLARWLERLAEFEFELQYRKGSASTNADGLSRRPCPPECKHCNRKEEKETQAEVNLINLGDVDFNWEIEQSKDPELCTAKRWLIDDRIPEWEVVSAESISLKTLWSHYDTLLLRDGVIFRKFYLPFGQIVEQLVVPSHLREQILTITHEQGHFGIKRTQEAIAQRFYWPRWKSYVVKAIGSCVACNQRKGPHSRTTLPIKRYQASQPMQRIAIDMLGPLPLTKSGNKYLLIVTDYFSKWVEAIAVPNQEATTVCSALIAFVSRFGLPDEIHSDQGRNFESTLIAMLCNRLGIVKTRTTPFRPQSDGQTERFNRTLLAALSKICDDQSNWDELVPLVCLYYRATVHAATGVTPALLMLGRELRLPVDLVFPPMPTIYHDSHHAHVTQLEQRLSLASEYARQHLRVTWDNMKSAAHVSRNIRPLDVNRPVLVFNPSLPKGMSPKLAKFWKGPFPIAEMISPYLYRIKIGGRRGTQVVHRSHIFQPRAPPLIA